MISMSDKKIKKIIEDIKAVRIQGARSVAVAGVNILKAKADGSSANDSTAFLKELKDISKYIISLRPTEPALRFGQDLVIAKVASKVDMPVDKLKIYAAKLCMNYIKETGLILKKIAEYGARAIVSGDVVMTHCHSHCVIEILKSAKRQGKDFTVIVTETRPLYQGEITAKELMKEGIGVIYCIDSASAVMMRKATKVLVGADAITADAEVINKIGTYLIAIAAKEYKVPFLVACGSHKYDPKTALGYPEPIEERKGVEIINPRKLRGVQIFNPAFDATPKEYIHEIITELGTYPPQTLISIIVTGKKER